MDYQKLKDEIKEIAAIAAEVPDPFREKCFELLLTNLIAVERRPAEGRSKDIQSPPPADSTGDGGTLPKPSQIRVFMTKTGVTDDQLKKVVMFEDAQIRFIREPSPAKVAQGQIEWALLLALKNAFEKNEFTVDPEAVRSVCQEKGFYDAANFAKNFKIPKNAELFRSALEPQGEAQPLSNDGHIALARVIKSLGGA